MSITYLVTGATGHIGFNVVRILTQKGCKTRALVSPDDPNENRLPEGCEVSREGEDWRIRYEPSRIPTAWLLNELQQAGTIRELTAQQQNIDHMIAAMYQEMDL